MEKVEEWEVEKILNKKKNKRGRKVLSALEEIYGGA